MCKCEHENFVKFGKDYKNNQKFRCKSCKKVWVSNQDSTHLTKEQKILIEKLLKENLSFRGIARVIGCSHVTIGNFLRKKELNS